MRWVRVIIVAVVTAFLQVSLMGALRVGGVVPNLALVAVVCFAIWGSASEAILAAILTGFIMDVSSSGSFGLSTSILVLIALGVVLAGQQGIEGQQLPTRLGLVAVATIVWALIHITAIGIGNLVYSSTWRVVGVEILLNSLLTLICVERIFYGRRQV